MAGLGSGVNFIPGDLSIPDSGNTSTTNATSFTGTWTLNPYTWTLVTCLSDAAGTITVQFSHDGATVHSAITKTVIANTGLFAPLLKGYRYVRILWSGALPTAFSLFTSHGDYAAGVSNLGSTIAADAAAQIVRSVDSSLDLAFGRFSGMEEDTKFGAVTNIDAADNAVTIWAFAGDALTTRTDRKTFPTSAATLYIASDAAGDTSLDFDVEVINGSGVRSTVSVSTDASDGTTPVAFATSAGMDVNRVELVGDTQTHSGNIYITNANDFTAGVPNDPANDVLAFIEAGFGQTQQATYFVPSGFEFRIKKAFITVARASGAAGSAEIHLRVKQPAQSWVVKRRYNFQNGAFEISCAGLKFDALTRIEWLLNSVSDTDTFVSVDMTYDLAGI